MRTYVMLKEQVRAAVRGEEGSEVAQAAGVALLAAAVIGAMLSLQGDLVDAVTGAFESLVGSL